MATDARVHPSKIALGLLPITTDPSGKLWVGKGGGRSCN